MKTQQNTSPSLRALKYFGRSNLQDYKKKDCHVAFSCSGAQARYDTAPRNDSILNALRRVNTLRADYHQSANQNGNALWFILIAIALLGLLTVMMSRSGSSTNETGSYEQNVIAANEILSYAKNMENAVQNLLARGCSENDLSFWHDSDGNGTEDASDDYFNPNSPTDHSCHIFDVAGAGMNWDTPNENWLDNSKNAHVMYGEYSFHTNCVNGVGRTLGFCNDPSSAKIEADLIIAIPYVKESICSAINSVTNDDSTIPVDLFNYIKTESRYVGSFAQDSTAVNYSSPKNPNSRCHTGDTAGLTVAPGEYGFYHVLHAR